MKQTIKVHKFLFNISLFWFRIKPSLNYIMNSKDFFSTTVHGDAASFCDAISD